MILHHYKLSPFSEKIRLMLGYCELNWFSAISPAMPPRPIVDPLCGGYRRIPIAQIGADMFCDTRIISSEIANLSERPELALENCTAEVQAFAEDVDSNVFSAVVRSSAPSKSVALLLTNFMPWDAYRFVKDRAGIARKSSLPRMSKTQASEILLTFKHSLEDKLQDGDFLFGESPTHADFSAYQVCWFANKIVTSNSLRGFTMASQWFSDMSQIGHSKSTRMFKNAVFEIAANNQPRSISKNMKKAPMIGNSVSVQPTDYAKDSVSGVLVGEDDLRWVIAKSTDQFGTMHVHFPKIGFEIKQV